MSVRINRIRITILDEMRKLRRKHNHSIQRHDLLQKRLEKCNVLLYGMAQPFNQ